MQTSFDIVVREIVASVSRALTCKHSWHVSGKVWQRAKVDIAVLRDHLYPYGLCCFLEIVVGGRERQLSP
jgi:hypothetical protein